MKETKESVVVPVILCGGSGTRLWPASRESYPKQFLSLMGGDFSMLQNTVKRALRAADASVENVVTVTLGSLESQVRNQLSEIDPAAARHVLCEPSARNTAAAVALAAEYVRKNFGTESIMWILPADHHIGNENDLALSLGYALKAARDGYLVTFGIRPTRPDTGYGYILLGDHLAAGNVCKAQKFVEKPNREVAQGYLDAGNYLWNSGMFLFETGAVLSEYRKHADAIHADVQAAMKASASAASPDANLYGQITKEPFDVAIMEKSEHVAIVPCDPEWSDIGSWESLWEIRQKDGNGNVIDGRAACHDTKNCLIQTKDLLVACAGLENIVVVETGDAILIADRSNSDAMKTIVGGLRKMGAREVIDVPPSPKAWSMTKAVDGESGYSVHEIVIRPGEKLALDAHSYPSKFWTVVEGHAEVTIGNESKMLAVHETAFIPVGVGYSVSNMTASELKIVEVNRGEQAQSRLRIFAPSTRTEAA